MKKMFALTGVLLALTACDSKVDISKYPEVVQRCYNGAYYNENNCNKDKVILEYCKCFTAKEANININIAESWEAGPKTWLLSHALSSKKDRMLDKASEECVKQTGYTRLAQCKAQKVKDVPETMDME